MGGSHTARLGQTPNILAPRTNLRAASVSVPPLQAGRRGKQQQHKARVSQPRMATTQMWHIQKALPAVPASARSDTRAATRCHASSTCWEVGYCCAAHLVKTWSNHWPSAPMLPPAVRCHSCCHRSWLCQVRHPATRRQPCPSCPAQVQPAGCAEQDRNSSRHTHTRQGDGVEHTRGGGGRISCSCWGIINTRHNQRSTVCTVCCGSVDALSP